MRPDIKKRTHKGCIWDVISEGEPPPPATISTNAGIRHRLYKGIDRRAYKTRYIILNRKNYYRNNNVNHSFRAASNRWMVVARDAEHRTRIAYYRPLPRTLRYYITHTNTRIPNIYYDPLLFINDICFVIEIQLEPTAVLSTFAGVTNR